MAAILEATIQVLQARGASRLTTTHIAQRAGVAVGTLYQYFPNKEALLRAVLEQHLDRIGAAVEASAENHARQPVAAIAEGIASDYLDVKIAHIDTSRAFYRVLPDLDAAELQGALIYRIEAVLRKLLASAPDARFADLEAVVLALRMVLVGMVRAVIESGASRREVAMLRTELTAITLAYLTASVSAP